MNTYLNEVLGQKVNPPQSEALDETQVKNSAGGFTWEIDDFARLRRFLILGSAGGTYYAGQSKLTKENFAVVERCIKADGKRTVEEILDISWGGRAPKNDQAIVALALCIAKGDDNTKRYALDLVPKICRIGTHLFQLVEFLDQLGALSGRAKRRALGEWYNTKTVDQAAYQAVKYRQRNGWTHRDVLRVAHAKAVDTEHSELFNWVVKGSTGATTPAIIRGFKMAQAEETTPEITAHLVRQYKLPREALKTQHLSSPEVWNALLDTGMGLTALIRNLANMTRHGVLTPTSEATAKVVDLLGDQEALIKARVHPMGILFALKTYASGGGFRSDKTWTPVTQIVDALDGAFYKAFGNVESSNQRVLLGLDVSGSMGSPIGDSMLTCRDASAAMALVTQNVEKRTEVVGFTAGNLGGWGVGINNVDNGWGRRYQTGLTPLNISSRQRLDDVVHKISNLDFGATDCSLPILYAKDQGKAFDLFVIYTDNETWAGKTHPAKALKDYRKSTGINAKLVVVGMTATEFSIANPKDSGMLDVVGFDTATPNIITEFASGNI